MLVRWTTDAASDLEEIVRYIRKDNHDAAAKVSRIIFDGADSLRSSPRRGRVGKDPDTREIVIARLPYILVYQVSDIAVDILHIRHGAQDMPRSH